MLVDHIVSPSPEDLQAFFDSHIHRRECVLQVLAASEIMYSGRAASMAEAGEFLTIIKPDGSLQVHGAKGVKPVNWQPKTNDIFVMQEADHLVLTAERYSPNEIVRISFLEPALAQAFEIQEDHSFVLMGSEADMQKSLKANPESIEEGLIILDEELPTSVGDIDLYAQDAQGNLVVMELKRNKATQEAVHQLARYVQKIHQQMPKRDIRGFLVAPDITNPAMKELNLLGLEFKQITALPEFETNVSQPGLFEGLMA